MIRTRSIYIIIATWTATSTSDTRWSTGALLMRSLCPWFLKLVTVLNSKDSTQKYSSPLIFPIHWLGCI